MVIDPPDGTIPYLPWAKEDREWRMRGENGALDTLVAACLSGMPRIETYSQAQWIRTKDQFVVFYELHHNYRFIKMDGRPPLNANIGGLWAGSSRGHWEGDTLVVDTINFTTKRAFLGSPGMPPAVAMMPTFKLTERFTRTAPDVVEWTVTVDDPSTWVRPWTFSLPLTINDSEPVMEYACHEGNYAMTNILSGERAVEKVEKAAAEAATK